MLFIVVYLQYEVRSEHVWEFRDELIKFLAAHVIFWAYFELRQQTQCYYYTFDSLWFIPLPASSFFWN